MNAAFPPGSISHGVSLIIIIIIISVLSCLSSIGDTIGRTAEFLMGNLLCRNAFKLIKFILV